MHRVPYGFLVVCLGALILAPSVAAAQDSGDAAANARLHLGPLALQPVFNLNNVGRDSNVFSSATNPQSDLTATFVPGVDSWLPVGRTLLSGQTSAEMVYFGKATTQRSTGFSHDEEFEVLLVSVTPFVDAAYLTTFQRPNPELDARVEQRTKRVAGGIGLRIGSKTTVDVSVTQSRLAFGNVTFDGINLAQGLDRRTRLVTGKLGIAVTPLTTFVVKAETERDRFTNSSIRDSDSLSVLSGFTFKPFALISGDAAVGFRRFTPRRADVPRFSGLIADVGISYVVHDHTEFDVKVGRNVDYSFDDTTPYFLTTTGGVTVTQVLAGNWDAIGRFSRSWLNYRGLAQVPGVPSANRVDRAFGGGVGISYRLAFRARIGFNVDYTRRLSPLPDRHYSGFRYGGTFTYGN